MRKENKSISLVIIVILAIIVLLLGGYIFYDKEVNNNQVSDDTSNNEKSITYNNKQMTGYYYLKIKDAVVSDDNFEPGMISALHLFEDGTFVKFEPTAAPLGEIGNYVIDGDKLYLNYLFTFNSGAGITYASEGSKELHITSNDEIREDDYTLKRTNYKEINGSDYDYSSIRHFLDGMIINSYTKAITNSN